MDLVYKTKVVAQGGRSGKVSSSDGNLALQLAPPSELGGKTPGPNPEQLFGAGFAACLDHSIRHICRTDKLPVKGVQVHAEVSLYTTFEGNYRLALNLSAVIKGLDRATAEDVVKRAAEVCPYVHATKTTLNPNIETIVID